MYSVSAIVFKVKECIFRIRKIQIKLQCKLENCLKMLKIASYERKKSVEVEPITFISILTI
jgi:hypothetical protein